MYCYNVDPVPVVHSPLGCLESKHLEQVICRIGSLERSSQPYGLLARPEKPQKWGFFAAQPLDNARRTDQGSVDNSVKGEEMELTLYKHKSFYPGRVIYGAVVGFLMSLPVIGAITFFLLLIRYLAFVIDLNRKVDECNKNQKEYREQNTWAQYQPHSELTFFDALKTRWRKILWFFVGFLPVKIYFFLHPFLGLTILGKLIQMYKS